MPEVVQDEEGTRQDWDPAAFLTHARRFEFPPNGPSAVLLSFRCIPSLL